jgi:hypothetical protein
VLRTPQTLIISLYAFGGFFRAADAGVVLWLTVENGKRTPGKIRELGGAQEAVSPYQARWCVAARSGFRRPSHISYRGLKLPRVSAGLVRS